MRRLLNNSIWRNLQKEPLSTHFSRSFTSKARLAPSRDRLKYNTKSLHVAVMFSVLFGGFVITQDKAVYAELRKHFEVKTLEDLRKRFQIGKVIGEGSFSKVRIAQDRQSDNSVAVKAVSKAYSDEVAMENEVMILKTLGNHENIISLIDVFDSERTLYIVTDLADNGELFDWIIEKGEMSEMDASNMMKHALNGLNHLHEKNIIHLDIKPENLLLTSDMKLKLADFGLAIRLPGSDFQYVRTECVGTPAYWAPELVKNESFGKGVDIWALGCVLYIILCGSHPFDPFGDSSESEILAKVVKGEYDVDSPSYELISPQAKDLIAHMLDPNTERRYSARQVLNHPWLSKSEQLLSAKPLPLNYLAKLKAFRALQLLRMGVSVDVEGCVTMFSSFDKNNDGMLSRAEMKQALMRVGVTFNTKEMDELFNLFNKKQQDFISVEDFKQTLLKSSNKTRKQNKLQHIKYLFDTLDKNKDGYIDKEDCLHLVDSLGLPQNRTKLFKRLQKYKTISRNDRDLIDFAEFVKFFRQMENQVTFSGLHKKRTVRMNRQVTVVEKNESNL